MQLVRSGTRAGTEIRTLGAGTRTARRAMAERLHKFLVMKRRKQAVSVFLLLMATVSAPLRSAERPETPLTFELEAEVNGELLLDGEKFKGVYYIYRGKDLPNNWRRLGHAAVGILGAIDPTHTSYLGHLGLKALKYRQRVIFAPNGRPPLPLSSSQLDSLAGYVTRYRSDLDLEWLSVELKSARKIYVDGKRTVFRSLPQWLVHKLDATYFDPQEPEKRLHVDLPNLGLRARCTLALTNLALPPPGNRYIDVGGLGGGGTVKY